MEKQRRDAQAQREAEARAAEAIKHQQFQEERQEAKAKLAIYHEEQAARQALAAARAEQERAAQLADLVARSEKNAERVAYRQVVQCQKEEEIQRRRAEKKAEEEAARQRLEALRLRVAVTAEADVTRTMGETASVAARKAEMAREREEGGFGGAGQVSAGYTDEQLMADPRFRMMTALGERGVLGGQAGSYATQVLMQAPTRKPTRVDNLTTGQIDTYAAQGRVL